MTLIILIIVLAILEGWHDGIITTIQRPYEQELIAKWHKLSFIYRIIVVAYIVLTYLDITAFTLEYWLTLAFIGYLYQFIFNTTINIYRRNSLWYLGNSSLIDRILKPLAKLYWVVSFIAICYVILTYFINK